MTEIFANIVSLAGLIVAVLAYAKSSETDRRDREAVIIIRPLWDRMGDDSTWVDVAEPKRKDRTIAPDERYVISTKPGKPLKDGLTLRKAEYGDDHNTGCDTPHTMSHLRIIEVSNGGRSAALHLGLNVGLRSSYAAMGDDHKTRDDVRLTLDGLGAGRSRYIEIRSLVGVPVKMHFAGVNAGLDGKQPVKLDAPDLDFNPRTAWGIG
ncbi:MAG TPA: hypothetical protein VGR69_01135 [Candidatus Rubrimentiphilum sp.]|nr:hypothetical protein [Candidatus Rubrimentiphilum sp.]